MDISIVIPSYNTQACIKETLSKLNQQTTTHRYEIIVVDCSDHDLVEDICLQFDKVTCVRVAERFNPGIGRNLGAKAASGKLLIFVDADVHLDERAVETAYKHFQEGARVFGGALELNTEKCDTNSAYLEHYFFNHESQANRPECERSNLSSAFMCFEKALFEVAGGFKDIPRMQDTELTERLIKEFKVKLLFFPDVLGLQTQDSPIGKVFKKIYINGQNVYYIRYQHSLKVLSKILLIILLPAIGLAKTLRIIGRHLKHQPVKAKIKTLIISPLLIAGGTVWTAGFYQALLTNKGISQNR